MIVIIEHGKGPAYPSVWLARSEHSSAEYKTDKHPYFAMYHTGELPPNYSMPAIPHEVEICSSFVMVCEMNDPQYKYGLITLYPT